MMCFTSISFFSAWWWWGGDVVAQSSGDFSGAGRSAPKIAEGTSIGLYLQWPNGLNKEASYMKNLVSVGNASLYGKSFEQNKNNENNFTHFLGLV